MGHVAAARAPGLTALNGSLRIFPGASWKEVTPVDKTPKTGQDGKKTITDIGEIPDGYDAAESDVAYIVPAVSEE